MRSDLDLLAVLATVAEARSFRAAAERLGVTRPAVSQAVRQLEDRLGVALLRRTTRSVAPTEVGQRLLDRAGGALGDLRAALAEAGEAGGAPRGLLRVAATSIAERFLSGPLVASFLGANPNVTLDVTVTDAEGDIVAGGFDVGVRLGEVIEADMIAVPLTGPQRQVAVAAPAYLARRGTPEHPRDLVGHACIGWRPSPGVAPYRWEFEEAGRPYDVAVEPRLTTNDMLLMVRAALAGGGITFGMEETFRPFLDRGELVSLLDAYLPPFPGFFLYFPSRRHMDPKLRALLDHVRQFRNGRESA